MAHAMVDGPLASTDADPFFSLNPHKEVKITPSGERTSAKIDLIVLKSPILPLLGSGPLDVWS